MSHVHKIQFCVDAFGGDTSPDSDDYLQDQLWTLTRKNARWLRRHPEAPNLYTSGVRYRPEPMGEENWTDIPTTLAAGWGDCEDLACWRAAELTVRQNTSAAPFFSRKTLPNGITLYHIKVVYPDGRVEDPSLLLGMAQVHMPYLDNT